MRIESATLHHVQIPFKGPFQHSRQSRAYSDAIVVVLRSEEGVRGFGEVVPRSYVTGESVADILEKSGPTMIDRLLGTELGSRDDAEEWCRQSLDPDHLALVSGFELAVLDLAGKTFRFGVGELLGSEPGPGLPRGVVIGFEIDTDRVSRHCAVLRLSGHNHIKVKVGRPDDVERLELVAGAFPDLPLRLDANGVWSPSEAIAALRALAHIPIASIEQPVGKHDLEGLKTVRSETGIPVMADESVCSVEDAERLIEMGAADIFNVRIGKHGGVLASSRIVAMAREAGLSCNLGTLVGETAILSRAAELFGRFVPGFECLDGKGQNGFLLVRDLVSDPATAQSADPKAPGLGIEVENTLLKAVSVSIFEGCSH